MHEEFPQSETQPGGAPPAEPEPNGEPNGNDEPGTADPSTEPGDPNET